MKFQFPEMPLDDILKSIQSVMSGRQLADMVSFNHSANKITVTISKLGTTVLTFVSKKVGNTIEMSLDSEKIAFTHRAFYNDVKEKLIKIIEKSGGKVL